MPVIIAAMPKLDLNGNELATTIESAFSASATSSSSENYKFAFQHLHDVQQRSSNLRLLACSHHGKHEYRGILTTRIQYKQELTVLGRKSAERCLACL